MSSCSLLNDKISSPYMEKVAVCQVSPANRTAVMEDECSSSVCTRPYSHWASRTWISLSLLAVANRLKPAVITHTRTHIKRTIISGCWNWSALHPEHHVQRNARKDKCYPQFSQLNPHADSTTHKSVNQHLTSFRVKMQGEQTQKWIKSLEPRYALFPKMH